jgi:hypothetical protein
MADTIPQHYTTQFSTNWIHRINQMRSRLDALCVFEDFEGERKRYDRVGSMTAQQRMERKGATRITDANTDSRWAYRKSYDLANLLDKDDAKNLGQLVLPTSNFIQEHAAAYNRSVDDTAWQAATGSVITGELGTDPPTPFPVATNHIGELGDVGVETGGGLPEMTIEKLLTAREILDNADADDDAPRVLVCTARQITDLLSTTKVASADYNTVRALAAGQIDTFMGFKFVRIKRLDVAAGVRTCVAWIKGAVRVVRGARQSRITQRDDLSFATQVYSEWNLGGTRVHDEAVVTINCLES